MKKAVKKAVVKKAVKKAIVKKAIKKAIVKKAIKRAIVKKAIKRAIVKKAIAAKKSCPTVSNQGKQIGPDFSLRARAFLRLEDWIISFGSGFRLALLRCGYRVLPRAST